MRDGGKGDTPRPLSVPMDKFDNAWDVIFNKKQNKEQNYQELLTEAPYHPGYEDAVEPSLLEEKK